MTVAATNKCNIAGLTKELVGKMAWGMTPDEDTYKAILENYAVSLDCEEEAKAPCYPDDCVHLPIFVYCSLIGTGITQSTSGNQITFTVTYSNTIVTNFRWTYDTREFTTAGAINQASIVLVVKQGKLPSSLVTPISVVLTDASNCTVTISCYYVQGVMHCENGFIPCSNPMNVVVKNKITGCSEPSMLTIKKKT